MKEFASVFHRHYPHFEIEGPRYLESFLDTDIFNSGLQVKETFLGALRVRVFVGTPDRHEYVHPQDVKEYLTRLNDAKLSSDFKLTIQLWSLHEGYRFGCICPIQADCLVRARNKIIASGLASQLKHLKAFRDGFEDERKAKLSMRITFTTIGDDQGHALAVEIPENNWGGDGETWLGYLRGALHDMQQRRRPQRRAMWLGISGLNTQA
jgi:hypothetical protein